MLGITKFHTHANDFVLEKLAKIYEDDGLVLIIGWYDHRNQENGGKKHLGFTGAMTIRNRMVS
jgi:hypothetical protein